MQGGEKISGIGILKKIKNTGTRIWRDIRNFKEVILIFTVYYIVMHQVFHAFCPSVLLTGFPCAGCGMTRAVIFMLAGQFARSWRLNPMALPVIVFAAYCVIRRYFLGKKVRGFRTGLIILCLGMLTAYAYRMFTIFPNRPPYVYTAGNFLEMHIPFYRDILRNLLGL